MMIRQLKHRLYGWLRNIGGPLSDRDTWPNGRIAFLSLLGYSVGLGNLTSFPVRCHRNGGATFLLAYFVMLLLIGIPVYFVEISLGQYVSQGPTYVFTHIAPIARGLGWGMLWLSFLTSIYYTLMIAWVLYYLYSATNLQGFPWDHCTNEFNTPDCYEYCSHLLRDACDISSKSTDYTNKTVASMEFFRYGLLNVDDSSKDKLGSLQPHLLICMAITWIFLALCSSARLKHKERILTFIVIFPYLVFGIMLLVVLQLPGNGIEAYLGKLDIERLLSDYKLWESAGIQVLYSTGIGFGGITTIASYNTLKQNALRDGVLVPMLDGATSFIGGLIIFCVLGDMARTAGVEIDELFEADHGFAFMIFTSALSRMPCGWNVIWTVLFLIMLLMVGCSSILGFIATCTTAIFDHFKALRRHKLATVGVICLIIFISGIPLCTQNGFYLFEFLKKYSTDPSILILVLLEVVIVCYCYGFNRFIKDVEDKNGMGVWISRPMKFFLYATLCCLTPLLLVFLLVVSIFMEASRTCSEPSWICDYQIIGRIISYSSLFIIISFGLYVTLHKKVGSIWKRSSQFIPEVLRRDSTVGTNFSMESPS
ncbi:unnamed protein product [Meganyctiphanes norvegica]|uniref:Sodium-dependent nutrient amino acid transporter 1 n=1 Tax=Meganyctiphanes norvegica TaxID=48144 RepID=A0AAV2PJF2_MEGNR